MITKPRKPTELKILEGNPGKRNLPVNEIKPIPIADNCPDWFNDDAREVWNKYTEMLERLGLLTEVDGLDFQNMCVAAADIKKLTIDINENGHTFQTVNGVWMARPEVNARNSAIKLVTTITGKFGMSPSDRVGLVSAKAEGQESEMERLLKK